MLFVIYSLTSSLRFTFVLQSPYDLQNNRQRLGKFAPNDPRNARCCHLSPWQPRVSHRCVWPCAETTKMCFRIGLYSMLPNISRWRLLTFFISWWQHVGFWAISSLPHTDAIASFPPRWDYFLVLSPHRCRCSTPLSDTKQVGRTNYLWNVIVNNNFNKKPRHVQPPRVLFCPVFFLVLSLNNAICSRCG